MSLKFANSYTRLPILIDLARELPGDEWFRLLGREWQSCDNIGQHISRLRRVPHFHDGRQYPVREMMTPKERKTLDAMPNTITVYRGCARGNIRGWSWSLDRTVAAGFPFLNRYKLAEPLLVTGIIHKRDVLALKMERKEQEIIAPRGVKIFECEALRPAADEAAETVRETIYWGEQRYL